LQGLLKFLNDQKKSCVLAIDEISTDYRISVRNTEHCFAVRFQQLHNNRFIFAEASTLSWPTSSRCQTNRFFQVLNYSLDKIDFELYSQFIRYLHEKNQI
jgi:hypothetical protein